MGCLAKTSLDQHLKLSPESHILFVKVFFDKKYNKASLGKNLWQQLLQGTRFFYDPTFSKICAESCPPSRKEGLIMC